MVIRPVTILLGERNTVYTGAWENNAMGIWSDEVINRIESLIAQANNAQIIERTMNEIRFGASSPPHRTYQISCEDHGYRVQDITGYHELVGEVQCYCDRDLIDERKMIVWLTKQLRKLN